MKTTTSQETLNYETGMTDGYRHYHRSPRLLDGSIKIKSRNPGWYAGFKAGIAGEEWKAEQYGES